MYGGFVEALYEVSNPSLTGPFMVTSLRDPGLVYLCGQEMFRVYWSEGSGLRTILPILPVTLRVTLMYTGCESLLPVRDWPLISGRGGYKMRKSRVRNFLRPPPPTSRQGKTFRAPPPFKEWKLFVPPPPTIWLMLQATT